MIFVLYGLGVSLFVVLVRWRSGRKTRRQLRTTPLAGYDTGVRSPRRVPGRFFTPTRGF